MRKRQVLVVLSAGAALGLGLASITRHASADAEPSSCTLAMEFGPLRAVMPEGWLLFEDHQGTVRVVDSRCQVKRIVSRR